MREAAGSPPPSRTTLIRALELETLPALELKVRYGMRPEALERMPRASGDSSRGMADVEADVWARRSPGPLFASGAGFSDIGPRTAEFSNALQPPVGREVLALFRGQQTNAWMRNFFEGFETGLSAAGLYKPVDRPPAICFLDLSGYTRLTEERGDAAAADLAGRLSRLVNRTSGSHGGKPIKWLGDGVMFHFREPGRASMAALEMVEGARGGAAAGATSGCTPARCSSRRATTSGRTVNVAVRRITDYARQGEVLRQRRRRCAGAWPLLVRRSGRWSSRVVHRGDPAARGATRGLRVHDGRRRWVAAKPSR